MSKITMVPHQATANSSLTPQVERLRISRKQFSELYPDLADYYDWFNNPPPPDITDQEFEQSYLKSKLWRLNNIYTVIDKSGNPVTFRMNYAQHRVYARSRQHPRILILKSRQQGISTFWLVSYIDDAIWCPYLNLGLMAQGTDEAATLLERTKFTWEQLSGNIKRVANVRMIKDNSKEVAFSNNSVLFIRVSFRSATLQRLHISELGKIANANPKRAKETKTGTLQALGQGNTGVIESTAEGKNMFKDMWNASTLALHSGQLSPKDFYPEFLSWVDDPDCVMSVPQSVDKEARQYFDELQAKTGRCLTDEQMWFWVAQRRELAGDVHQEYPATPEEAFMASKDGTYYSRKFNEVVVRGNRVRQDLYDPNLPIDVYIDIGVDDYFVMVFVQWYRGDWKVIGEYLNEGYDMAHYVDYAEEHYEVSNYNFPHDIAVREVGQVGGGRAKTRRTILREYFKKKGYRGNINTIAKSSIANGIEAVRSMLNSFWIDPCCEYIIDCLNNYSKEWDDSRQQWKVTPAHDEYSHGADVLRGMATSEKSHGSVSRYDRPARSNPGRAHAV